jgi:DNA polymerase III delta prime subunit
MIKEDVRTLNQGQQEASDGFFAFLFSDEKEMIISGPGGVGKTFTMGQLIDEVMPRYFSTCKLMGIKPEYDEIMMTATTNKAAEVLGQATKRPTGTIHSFLNLTVKDDMNTGRAKLTKTGNWKVHERKIIFVDECSMLDSPLEKALLEGTHKSKIVYVGDHCQLAPVTEEISPIYKRGLPFFELTQPMRNAGQPALMAICQQLRNTVETGVFHPIQIVPGVIDHVDDAEMQAMLKITFAQQTKESRILAWSNDQVGQYNNYIRAIRHLPPEYQVGEILVNNSAFKINRRDMLSVEQEIEITELASGTYMLDVDDKNTGTVMLEVRNATLKTNLSQVYHDVPLPVDRNHYSELLNYYRRQKNWSRFFFLKNTIPDLRPRDAATIHKAQGSSYDTVFIDVGNLSTCHLQNVVARLLYVAFSRARTRVILYGDLSAKYGGLVS